MKNRIEKDSIGEMSINQDKYFGINTQRALNNFQIRVNKTDLELIKQIAQIKRAAAMTNEKLNRISSEKSKAIQQAAQEINAGEFDDQFLIPEIQGGAGTSTNMNVNEVIANRGLEILHHQRGQYQYLSPQDDVNAGQSTNDVYPSAGKLTIYLKTQELEEALVKLIKVLQQKGIEFKDVSKIGRTQLQEAVPTTLGNTFNAFANGLKRCLYRLKVNLPTMLELNLGGTAIGTGVNTSKGYQDLLYSQLQKIYQVKVHPAFDLIDGTQNLDSFVQISGSLKALAVTMSKMSHDLRLLSSGPRSGFNEIHLPARQAGSSIMPGKVNPVIPEVVSQIAFQVIGNDTTVTLAAESGELELNAFEPVIFHNLFESIELLKNACQMLTTECIPGIKANKAKCQQDLDKSVETVTKLTPIIGYQTASEVVTESLKTGVDVYKLLRKKKLFSNNKETAKKLNEVLN
ncbi:aspartate ammonia-lyase [Companilactobacillus sp. HBUAS59544]|uniref:aspartate ammonia-lyase n=1 Tax=Companilactobacillus sp. HBUAS59544 TaxID=3109363 RepID=UPI002FF14CF5